MHKSAKAEISSNQESISMQSEIRRLAEAMMAGSLDERGDHSTLTGEDAELVLMVNKMLDSLVAPLRLASGAIGEIANGRIPHFVIDDFNGEFNDIKHNLNALLATIYGMHNETQNLIGSIGAGKLRTRGNDWDYEGIWRDLIAGVNGTLDAVLDPVYEASSVLGSLANYDLSARMHGKYHGEHAVIKKAMNTTAEALHSAISQVSETVDLVSDVGNRISHSSQIVSNGAAEQQRQLAETSENLTHISESSIRSARSTDDARGNARNSVESITTGKEAMERMLEAMGEIRDAADNTASIVQEINSIAKETDSLSSSAAEKAIRVRSSAGGFGVVANEIRNLSMRCEEAVVRLQDFNRRILAGSNTRRSDEVEQLGNDFQYLIDDLNNIAMLSGLLGVNAAIEAAHVEGAGNDFEILTDEIHQLAKRSTDAARLTDSLIQGSVVLARKGERLSKEIDDHLAIAVDGANTIGMLTDEISLASQEQATGIDLITRAVSQINEVTSQNAESAHESSEAAKNLETQVEKLSRMVSKFRLHSSSAHGLA